MTLHIHRAERADLLALELGRLLRTPLDDPFTTEIVAVPTQGVERWLAQTLAAQLGTSADGRDGICAGVDFPSPRRLTATAVASVSSVDPASDPWLPRRAAWPLLKVMDSVRGEEWAALLWSYLGDPAAVDRASAGDAPGASATTAAPDPVRRGRRWSTAQHLAELYGDYAGSRPQMLLRWREGHDVDASGRPLPPEYVWQAELWRRLRLALDLPSPAERTGPACARLRADPGATDLPARLSLFGPTRLLPEHRAVLAALAQHREVHLWLSHPSPALWRRLAEQPSATPGPRRLDRSAERVRHPLLGYLGRDVRELQLSLAGDVAGPTDVHHTTPAAGAQPHPHPQPQSQRQRQPTLLAQLQDDIASDRAARPFDSRPLLAAGDRSVSVHACHGPDRQVEVLRELLVGLLADDPTLEPRDIVVLCPDIERFAPLISASFGLHHDEHLPEHPGHRLRVRLADRALRQVNPLLAALSRVLALAGSRLEAPVLLDLCGFAPVAHKFSFSEDELQRLQDLVVLSGVRWGLDAEHRQAYAMGQFGQNTWAAGLDRLLLGVTMDETDQHYLGTALPLDDVDSADVDLVGRLAELVDRLRVLFQACGSPRSLAGWVQLCRSVIEQLTSVPASDSWQLTHAYGELATVAQTSGDDPTVELTLPEVQALLADTFRGRATRANFRTGSLTMCTLLPMRSVPHRVVCLLGLDDGVFPRHSARDGDDVLAAEPWVGDRDPRSEDRQLLLDALMSAREHLVVVYSGADARTRADRPPAVPVQALLDTLDVTVRTGNGRTVSDTITTRHPLQPFDTSNFVPGRLTGAPDEPFSFDPDMLRGAVAAERPRRAHRTTFDPSPLEPLPLPDVIALADLVRFFQHPVKALLRVRAGLSLGAETEAEQPDQIPVQLDPLEAWGIGDRLLRLHLDGVDLERLKAAEWRRGGLPPRVFGDRALRPVLDRVREVADVSRPFLTAPRTAVDVLAEVGAHTVAGTLSSVYGDRSVQLNYSWVGPKHRLQSWLELLALSASWPDRPWQAVTLGRGKPSVLGPVPGPWATRVLADLLELYRSGLSEPLALGPKTASEYARIRYEDKSIGTLKEKLERMWGEERDASYETFLGPHAPLEVLLAQPSRPDEERGSLGEPSRFGSLARRVWQPLLRAEEVLG